MFNLSYSLIPKTALFTHILNILGSFLNTKALICMCIKLAIWARGVCILVYFYLTEAVLRDKNPHCGMCEAWCCWCSTVTAQVPRVCHWQLAFFKNS